MVAANPAIIMQHFDQNMIACMGVLMGGNSDGADEPSDEPESAPAPAPERKKAKEPEPEPEPTEPEDAELAAAKVRVVHGYQSPDKSTRVSPCSHQPTHPVPSPQKEAAALKDEGTAAYKKKDFAKALELYTKAAERMPTDMVYLLNKGGA